MTTTLELHQSLTAIRGMEYTSRNASKGAALPDLYALLTRFTGPFDLPALKQFIYVQDGLGKKTRDNREAIWYRLKPRYFHVAPQWVGESLRGAASEGLHAPAFVSLAYLYYVLADRLTFDFVAGPLWQKWLNADLAVRPQDFALYLEEAARRAPEIGRWSEQTRKKLSSITLTALRDFGLLAGKAHKRLTRPPVAPETVFHLLTVLWAEGRRGRALLESPDWRLFLWQESDIAEALNDLSQRRWIRFERGGQSLILEMIRTPERGQE